MLYCRPSSIDRVGIENTEDLARRALMGVKRGKERDAEMVLFVRLVLLRPFHQGVAKG